MRRIMFVSLAAMIAGCGGSTSPSRAALPSPGEAEAGPAAVLPAGHPVVVARSLEEVAAPTAMESGTVLEVLAGGGYTYARVSLGDSTEQIWVAGPETLLEVGQEVGLADAASMGTFSSPSLQRTFENLYFVGGFQTASSTVEGSPVERLPVEDGLPARGPSGVAQEVLVGGGYTYVLAKVGEEEIWLAGPQTEVAVGDTVSWSGGVDMGEFHSPTLARTFESIVFVDQFWVKR